MFLKMEVSLSVDAMPIGQAVSLFMETLRTECEKKKVKVSVHSVLVLAEPTDSKPKAPEGSDR